MKKVSCITFIILLGFRLSSALESFPILTDSDTLKVTLVYHGSKVCLFGKAPDSSDNVFAALVSADCPPIELVKEEKRLIFWLAVKKFKLENMPALYMFASAKPENLSDLLSSELNTRNFPADYHYHLSHSQTERVSGKTAPDDFNKLYSGFIELKEKQGLYKIDNDGIVLHSNGLFHYKFKLCDRVPMGKYKLRVLSIKEGRLNGWSEAEITVKTAGLAAQMANLAQNHPLIFGLLASITAFAAGALANMIFRMYEHG